jgi:hypothetical protein
MKKSSNGWLTPRRSNAILRRMPIQKTTPTGRKTAQPLKGRKNSVVQQYKEFFVPAPSPTWQHDEDNFSLDQPSPVKWVQTETTYGIDVTLCPMANA